MAIAIPEDQRVDIKSLATAGQWTTITLPNVPAGATGVIVSFYGDVNSNNAEGAVRTIGCGLDGNAAYQIGTRGEPRQLCRSQHWAEMNGSNQVEIWINSVCTFALIDGWLEAGDVTFLPTCQDMWGYLASGDQTTPNTDHTFDLSAISGGASAVLVTCRGTGIDGLAAYAYKRPAESYWRENFQRGTNSTCFVYPLDGSGQLMMKFSHYQPTFQVLGFMGTNFTPYTTAPEAVAIGSSSWETAQVTTTSQTAHIGVFDTMTAVWGGMQQIGQPPRDIPDHLGYGQQYFIGLNATKQYQHMFVDAVHEPASTWLIGYFDPATTPTGPTISSVSDNNTISHGSQFVISGSFPTTVTGVKIVDGALETACSISGQDGSTVTCNVYDAFSGNARFGSVVLDVTDGTESDTHNVTVAPGTDYQYITLVDPLIADGLNKETTSGNGDQIALEIVNGVATTLYADANVLFNPATPNGTVLNRYAHDGSTWNADTITVYRGSVTGVSWTGVPNPPNPVIGQQYDYVFGGFVQGDRPITYTMETGQLPDGITIDSDNEKFTGVATDLQAFTNLTIKADNGAASMSIQVVGSDV